MRRSLSLLYCSSRLFIESLDLALRRGAAAPAAPPPPPVAALPLLLLLSPTPDVVELELDAGGGRKISSSSVKRLSVKLSILDSLFCSRPAFVFLA